MNSKVLILSVAVIAIGLFAMPSTLSLFAGQHTFDNGSNVECSKCHADIYSELQNSNAHTNPNLQLCEGCHRTNQSTFDATLIPKNGTANLSAGDWAGTNVTDNGNAHAAITMECIGCHQGVPAELLGSEAAHSDFYNQSNYTNGNQTQINLKGANTACVGCHTHAVINVTWTRAGGYNLTANSTSGSWVMNFALNNTAVNST